MNIDIQDAALEARMQKQLQATGFGSVRGRIGPQEEQDRSPLENCEAIDKRSRGASTNSTAAKESRKTKSPICAKFLNAGPPRFLACVQVIVKTSQATLFTTLP
ncbi:MAG: hypothetical protein ABSF78_05665 [Candidatus Acidiferrales bacterium]